MILEPFYLILFYIPKSDFFEFQDFESLTIQKNHFDKIGPVSTMAFVTLVWMTVTTCAGILADRGVQLHIHPSHNVPGDTTAMERLNGCIEAYKKRSFGL